MKCKLKVVQRKRKKKQPEKERPSRRRRETVRMNIRERAIHLVLIWMKAGGKEVGELGREETV